MEKRVLSFVFILTICVSFLFKNSVEAEEMETSSILIEHANVFNGKDKELKTDMSVLIEGNKITKIDRKIKAPVDAVVINARGKTLMPGLIDAHWHSILATLPQALILMSDAAYLNINGEIANRDVLMRGFTTVRDTGGNVFGLKKATDEGLIIGPRIYPSGGMLTQTSGHADFRDPLSVPSNDGDALDYLQRTGQALIADGVPQVLKRSREVLRMGASQIKAMAGGGVSSPYDPIDVSQYTFDEMKAIVDVADTWNTYVTVHAFTDKAVQTAIKAGVKCIEHGHLLTEETIKLMVKKGVWLSMQPVLDDEDAIPFPNPLNRAKFIKVTEGTENVYELAKKHNVKLAWGTDTLFDPELARKQGKQLFKMQRWFTPFEVLKMATYDNAQLLKLSGERDPYPGELGVVLEGALADLILVDGNPLEDLELVANAQDNFVLIIKDGKIFKNTIRD